MRSSTDGDWDWGDSPGGRADAIRQLLAAGWAVSAGPAVVAFRSAVVSRLASKRIVFLLLRGSLL